MSARLRLVYFTGRGWILKKLRSSRDRQFFMRLEKKKSIYNTTTKTMLPESAQSTCTFERVSLTVKNFWQQQSIQLQGWKPLQNWKVGVCKTIKNTRFSIISSYDVQFQCFKVPNHMLHVHCQQRSYARFPTFLNTISISLGVRLSDCPNKPAIVSQGEDAYRHND